MFAASKTAGAAAAVAANYIEDVFSTYLYTGNGSTQTITNGIDLAGKGGMTWLKCRNNTFYNSLYDTVRGATKVLYSNDTLAEQTYTGVTSFDSTGFTLGSTAGNNGSPYLFASWTFRKQPKFFDVVTYTGNGAASRSISHALGSRPGFVVIKRTDSSGDWFVAAWYGVSYYIGTDASPFALNSTLYASTSNGLAASSTSFDPNEVTLSNNYGVTPSNANINGATYVAYLFASNAGGFGLAGTDNVISCGSFTTDGSGNASVTLGYEPQWVLVKRTDQADGWFLLDTMRGLAVSDNTDALLFANTAAAEIFRNVISPTATGFVADASSELFYNATYIYIAIRRGPMKVPTDATKVFEPTNVAQASAPYAYSGFPVDMAFRSYTPGGLGTRVMDRLRGASSGTQKELNTTSSAAETDTVSDFSFTYNTGISAVSFSNNVFWMFRRAPSFFDEVCWTGTNTYAPQQHNLGVVPELVIQKTRSNTSAWNVAQGGPTGPSLYLQTTAASGGANGLAVTTTTFDPIADDSPRTYVAYLFATCAGVSKVGSYTGTGSTQTINCGFTGGARFVLIKRTDSTSDWFVWDTARGMVSGTDPSLSLNTTSAESNANSVYTATTGFQLLGSPSADVNTSGGTYIFLAIA